MLTSYAEADGDPAHAGQFAPLALTENKLHLVHARLLGSPVALPVRALASACGVWLLHCLEARGGSGPADEPFSSVSPGPWYCERAPPIMASRRSNAVTEGKCADEQTASGSRGLRPLDPGSRTLA